jgi:EpsI family protein
VAGFTDYLLREYVQPGEPGADERWFSVYVGYYDTQTRGRTIHSPKNCLPGSGWEALNATRVMIPTPQGEIEVNRYLLQREDEQALVLYWYQGRGRMVASEYRAKWDLLRDAALHRRSEESLVRIVVPVTSGDEALAFDLARNVALRLQPALEEAMPVL